jgi:hypothetical protein
LCPKNSRPGANLARFWELLGRRTFEEGGILWGEYKGPLFTSLPFHLKLDLAREEAAALLRRHHVAALRFPSNRMPGMAHGIYVLRPAGYDLKAVSRKQRGHIVRGLEICEIRDVDPDELLTVGIELNRDTLARQARQDPGFVNPVQWKRFVCAVRDCPGMSVRGAYVDGRLATYLVFCRDGGWLHLMYKMSRTADMACYSNHALDYSILSGAACDAAVECVTNGFVSLIPDEGLDRYKRQLGYTVEPHNLCIHFHPLLAPVLASKWCASLSRVARSLFPGRYSVVCGSKVLEGASVSLNRSGRTSLSHT